MTKRILEAITTILLVASSVFAQAPAYTQGASFLSIANASSTGTTVNALAKLTGAPSTAVIAGTADNKNGVVIGIVVSGAGTSGSATISTAGETPCVFDGATTAGDFITVSTSTGGDCHDSSALPPSDGSQIIGRVLSTNASGGTYNIALNPSLPSNGIWNGAGPSTVYLTSTYTNATTTFSNVTGLSFPVLASQNYHIDCTIIWQGSAATTGPKYQFTGPASPTSVAAGMASTVTATTFITSAVTAFSSAMANTGTVTAATNFMDNISLGLINGTTAGTVQLQAAANGAGTLTVQPGSFCSVQ